MREALLLPVCIIAVATVISSAIGCATPSQGERRVAFHKMVTATDGDAVYVDRMTYPNTCWALIQPEEHSQSRVLRQVDCDAHREVLQDP